MALPEPSSFVGNGPNYLADYQSGYQAALQPLTTYNDAQAQVAQRAQQQAALEAIQQRNQLNALLMPGEVARQGLENTGLGYQNTITGAGIPYAASNAANANAIGTANATYALPNAGQEYFSRQLGNAQAMQGIGPVTINGQVARPAIPLPGPAAFQDPNALPTDPSQGDASTLTAKATGYHPVDSSDPNYKMEGGHLDAQGNPIATLDDYRSGKSPFVTAAIDRNSPLFGKTVFSPTLNAPIRLSDTGSAFTGKGNSRIDIARDTASGANSDENNGPIQLTLGNTAPTAGIAAPPLSAASTPNATSDATAPDLSNLTPIGQANSTSSPISVSQDGGALDRAISTAQALPGAIPLQAPAVHPAVNSALSVASQTAGIAPLASQALASKAVDLHNSLSIPVILPQAPVPGYIDETTGQPVYSTIRKNSFVTPPPKENPDFRGMVNSGHTSGTPVSPFIHDGMFDTVGYEDAVGKSTTELRETGQKFTQALLQAKPAVDAIDAYASLPDNQRNGAADNQAINNAVIAETGALPTESSRNGFLEHHGLGDTVARLSAQFTKPNDPPFLSKTQLQDVLASGKNSLTQRAQTFKDFQSGGAGAVADSILSKANPTPSLVPTAIPAGKIVTQNGVRYQKQPDGSFTPL